MNNRINGEQGSFCSKVDNYDEGLYVASTFGYVHLAFD